MSLVALSFGVLSGIYKEELLVVKRNLTRSLATAPLAVCPPIIGTIAFLHVRNVE